MFSPISAASFRTLPTLLNWIWSSRTVGHWASVLHRSYTVCRKSLLSIVKPSRLINPARTKTAPHTHLLGLVGGGGGGGGRRPFSTGGGGGGRLPLSLGPGGAVLGGIPLSDIFSPHINGDKCNCQNCAY